MTSPRRLVVAAGVVLAAVPGALAIAQSTAPGQEEAGAVEQQKFFTEQLQADAKTSTAVKRLLTKKAGFVDQRSGFVDVTGDGKSDAIVLVTVPGIAGTVALYIFTTDGGTAGPDTTKLRVVFRSQQLYRATFKIRNGTLVVRTPKYAKGDEPQAPSALEERDYLWTPSTATMRRVDRREFPLGGVTPQAAARR